MPVVRVQARFNLAPGDGTNVAVNTFHFTTEDASFALAAGSCIAAVGQFYTTPPPTLFSSVGSQMADTVNRAFELRAYDMEAPPPRIPVVAAMTLPASDNPGSKMPLDVCACLSYTAEPPVNGRKRGRIFIPGVSEGWMTTGSPTAIPLLSLAVNTETYVLVHAAKKLRDFPGVEWVIRSMATGVPIYYPIVAGYVDAEPDTQRRRGLGSGAPRLAIPA